MCATATPWLPGLRTTLTRRYSEPILRRSSVPFGLTYPHAASVDMLVDAVKPTARSAIHLVFVGKKVRREYLKPVLFSPPAKTVEAR